MKKCQAANCGYNVFSNGFCIRHQHLRVDEKYVSTVKKKQSILMKPRKGTSRTFIKRVSKKMSQSLKVYHGKRIIFLLERPRCEIKVSGCTGEATTVHHSKGRIGPLLNDVRYWVPGCMNCHTWVENNPAEAKERGFSVSRLAK